MRSRDCNSAVRASTLLAGWVSLNLGSALVNAGSVATKVDVLLSGISQEVLNNSIDVLLVSSILLLSILQDLISHLVHSTTDNCFLSMESVLKCHSFMPISILPSSLTMECSLTLVNKFSSRIPFFTCSIQAID